MGCGSDIEREIKRVEDDVKEGFSDFDDHVIKPIVNNPFEGVGDAIAGLSKHATGESAMRYAAHKNWVGEDDYQAYKGVTRTALTAAQIVGGIALAPVTGGLSLGMTYGAMSGAALSYANGGDWNDAMRAGYQGGFIGAAGGVAGQYAGNLLAPHMPANISSGAGAWADKAANVGINQLTYGVGGYGGARAAGLDDRSAVMFGIGSGFGAGVKPYAGGMGAGTLLAAGAGGMTLMQSAGGQSPSGGVAGGGYQAPGKSVDNAVTGSGGGGGGKKVPEAQFLDVPSGNWGNAGMGGVFGGLDNLKNKDKFFNVNEIADAQSQRALGAFVK